MVKELLIDWNEYDIYEDGRIYSKGYNKNKYLTGNINKYGYVQVGLKCIDKKYRNFRWHRVIWTYFNGEIPDGYEINHLDENKQNNRLSNLSLTSHVENCNWKSRNERIIAKLKNHPLKSKSVIAVDKDGNVIYKFESTMEAGRKGFNQGHVAACCRGERRMHKGLRWYYS